MTATQPAKATAAWPDGSPPRNGVPRPVHAFVAMTMKTTRTSATSVMSAGASRTRSSVFVARSPTALWKTRKPIAMAVMEAISTAPAAMSFASFAFGSKDVVETSMIPSIAVFSISATSTNAIARTSAMSWSRVTPTAIAAAEDEHGREEVDAEVPLRAEDVDDPLEGVVEAVDQGRRPARSGRRRAARRPLALLVLGVARQRRDAHPEYTASRASISGPWS